MKFTRAKWLSVLALLLVTFAVLAGCNETTPPAVTDEVTDIASPPPETEVEATIESESKTDPATDSSDSSTETEPPKWSCPLHPGNDCECAYGNITETEAPTEALTETPTEAPTEVSTEAPTEEPTEEPTEAPTEAPTETPTEAPAEPEHGHEVGDLCYDATLPLVGDQGSYTVSGGKGQVIILNFWGNWCPPCRNELPHFDRIADEYEGRVQVVTIHSNYALSGAESYIQTNYPDSKMIFTYDEGDVYYDLLARDNAWPITFVLDEEGIIRNRFRGAITYEQLQNVLSNLLP